jgi:hypothetical protein
MDDRPLPTAWNLSLLADHVQAALSDAEQAMRLEQAVHGIDAMDEVSLHALLAERLTAHYAIAREVHYPSSIGNKLTHRKRCDLVLTPLGHPLQLDFAPPTLFDPPNQVGADVGFWLEVKAAWQFRAGGVRHGGYGAQWRNGIVADLRKMEAESAIRNGGLLLIVFNESDVVLEKDLTLFEDVLAEQEVLAGDRQVRTLTIVDRIGHSRCTAAIWPTVIR